MEYGNCFAGEIFTAPMVVADDPTGSGAKANDDFCPKLAAMLEGQRLGRPATGPRQSKPRWVAVGVKKKGDGYGRLSFISWDMGPL